MITKRMVIFAMALGCVTQASLCSSRAEWESRGNYYKILGVDSNASKAAIKKAYLGLAKTKHPDKGGDPEKFKEIVGAYETLSDDEKRKSYDNFLNEKHAEEEYLAKQSRETPILTLNTSFQAPQKTAAKFTFEFKNKVKDDVAIALISLRGNVLEPYSDLELSKNLKGVQVNPSTGSKESEHGYLRIMGLDPSKSYQLIIKLGSKVFTYKLKYSEDRQRILLTLDKSIIGNITLQPQKGKGNKSQSGIPLEGNIQDSEIEKVK